MDNKTYAVCIDIGATTLKYALVDASGNIAFRDELPSDARYGAEKLLIRVKEAAANALEYHAAYHAHDAVAGIGIGSAGQIDPHTARVIFATDNIPGYTGTDLRREVGEPFGLPLFAENDVNSAALGEVWKGAGQGFADVLMMTLGSGVGGAIVHNGKVVHGASGSAGEVGHMVLIPEGQPCTCGMNGCYEQYGSARALLRIWQEEAEKAQAELPKNASAPVLCEAARAGDSVARSTFQRFANYLAMGMISLIHILNPSCIIVGGGISNQSELFLPETERIVRERIMPSFAQKLHIVPAQLTNDAGLMGAARLVFDGIAQA